MKKFGIQLVILLLVIFGSLYFSFNQGILKNLMPSVSLTQDKVKVGNALVDIEIADTPAKRSQGLSSRESLATDSGMLFVFPQAQKYQFWMKGMKFALDFIFIRDGKVVDLLHDIAPPLKDQKDHDLPIYEPTVPIDMLLEINSGFAAAHQIKAGDQVFLVK